MRQVSYPSRRGATRPPPPLLRIVPALLVVVVFNYYCLVVPLAAATTTPGPRKKNPSRIHSFRRWWTTKRTATMTKYTPWNPPNTFSMIQDENEPHSAFQEEALLSSSTSTTTAGLWQSLWKQRTSILSGTLTGIQWGLVAYLAFTIVQTVKEVYQELYNENNNNNNNNNSHSAQTIRQILEFLEQDPQSVQEQIREKNHPLLPNNNNNNNVLLQLALRFMATGVPLRSSSPQQSSVEQILLSLTKSEIQLLHQCLWTYPPPIRMASSSSSQQPIGLSHVQQALLATISTVTRSNPSGTPQHLRQKFATLFDQHPQQQQPSDENAPLTQSCCGILLYGPPGCGKTYLVKTVAQQTNLPCLVITPSVLLRKYVGETNSQVRTLFTLASKLSPCILCIDELDGLFRERSENEHEVSRDLKTEFLQWMDGMLSVSSKIQGVIVVGATNRPFDVDSAVLRRLSQSFFVGLPEASTRQAILQKAIESVPAEEELRADLASIAAQTEGYSPSDLRQLLQTAALSGPIQTGRPLSREDIQRALQSVSATPLSNNYRESLLAFRRNMNGGRPSPPFQGQSSMGTLPTKWETHYGNFYSLGTIHIDHDTFNMIEKIMEDYHDNENDDSD